MLMSIHMFPHCSAVGEAFVAKITDIGLLAGVNPEMLDEVGPLLISAWKPLRIVFHSYRIHMAFGHCIFCGFRRWLC